MPHQTDRLTWKSLIFHHAVVFLLLTHSHEGQCQENGQSSELISALLGENITLPCHVSPATDAVNMLLEWARPDLDPRFVHVRRDGEDWLFEQHSSYKGRTSVSIDGLRRGDVSLKLSKVTFSDEGTYRCFVPGFGTDTSIKLVVDVFIKITNISRGVLQCESTGWYPEPEVFWLDGEGNLLSAGPTETVRGSDDLYTVSSRVTVEKRHSNSFTCRVQQNSTDQTREAIIHVPDDFFKEPSGSGSSVAAIIFALAGVTSVLAVCFVVWKRKQMRNNSKTNHVKEETTGGREASEQERLIKAAEGEPLKNQSKVDEGGRMDEVQTTEDLDNTEKESKSVCEGSPDQEETETLREKPEKSEDTGDQKEGTKSETEGQGLMEGGQQPVGAGGEAKTDPHKVENKEQTQTESAGQSPADGDQLPAGEGTNPGMEENREGTKSVSEGSSDQEETETIRQKPEKGEETGDQGLMEGGQQPVGAGGEEKTDPHKEENKETESAGQSPADGGRQGGQTPAGEGTHVGLEEKKEEIKAEGGGGGDKTSTKENSTPQSPGDEQTGQLKDTDRHNTVDQNDKNKEADISIENVTAGQRQTAAQTQHKDETDKEKQSDDDTESVSDTIESPSSANPKTKTGQQTGEESESPESRGENEAEDGKKPEENTDSVSDKSESPSSVHSETKTGQQSGEESESPESRGENEAEDGKKPEENTDSVSDKSESPSSVNPETKTGQQSGEESEKSPGSRDGDKNKTSGDDATTPDQNSAEDGESVEEKKKDGNSQRVNDPKNRRDDTDASSNNSGSQNGSDREKEQVDKDSESDAGSSV